MTGTPRPSQPRSALTRARRRQVPDKTRLRLFVRAGGRCEFDGCNRYLLEHHLTRDDGNFAQMAHICAFSPQGPRGADEPIGPESVHDVSNLMLLCPECHKLIDDHPDRYTVDVLRTYKKAHEDRVFTLTDTQPDRHTVALAFTARIGGRAVSVTVPEMQAAVAPRYLGPRDVVSIDLGDILDVPDEHYWRTAAESIRRMVSAVYEQRFSHGPARHVSVFALGPIPLLVYLGSCLSDKVPMTLYQRHRDTEDWRWKEDEGGAAFEFHELRRGRDSRSVALLLSVSGRIRASDLPGEIDDRSSVYEVALAKADPSPDCLQTEESLREFRGVFRTAMRRLVADHRGLDRLHLFPAVPAPVAVAIGRDLLPKRDPAVLVYDYDRRAGGFVPTLEVNTHDSE